MPRVNFADIGRQIVGVAGGRRAGYSAQQGRHRGPQATARFLPRALQQVVLGAMSVYQRFAGAVIQIKQWAVGVRGVVRPVAAVLILNQFLDVDLIEVAGGIRDRAVHKLVARGFAVDLHQAHGDAADGDDRSVLEDLEFAEDFESLEKQIDANAKTDGTIDEKFSIISGHRIRRLKQYASRGRLERQTRRCEGNGSI